MEESLYRDFEVVHGRAWWPMARAAALAQGVIICNEPPPVSVAVLYRGAYAGSVGVIEHEGLLLYEWFVLSPEQPLSVRHGAAMRMMQAGKDYAQGRGKTLTMVVDRRRGGVGIAALARRMGFASRNEHVEVLEGASMEQIEKRVPASQEDLAERLGQIEQIAVDMAARVDEMDTMVRASTAAYTAEDHELIKAHVRHPGALEAAKLKERLRCVRTLLYNAGWIEGTTPSEEHAPALCAMIAGILRNEEP